MSPHAKSGVTLDSIIANQPNGTTFGVLGPLFGRIMRRMGWPTKAEPVVGEFVFDAESSLWYLSVPQVVAIIIGFLLIITGSIFFGYKFWKRRQNKQGRVLNTFGAA